METIKLTKLLYRVDEVAALLSDSTSKIYELIESGELQAHCRNGIKTKPVKITASSITAYYDRYLVAPEEYHA